MSDVYEPWTPEVGQRVRVSISPECQSHARAMESHYIPVANGRTGTVVTWGRYDGLQDNIEARYPGHRYMVRLDVPLAPDRPRIILAAAELEPLEAPR